MSLQLFVRVKPDIFHSSLSNNRQARYVFLDMLLASNEDGIVSMGREAFCRLTNWPASEANPLIDFLEAPDPNSTSPDEEGRRIVPLADDRDIGWRIVNWERHNRELTRETERTRKREGMRALRARRSQLVPPPQPPLLTRPDVDKTRLDGTPHLVTSGNNSPQNATEAAGAAPTSDFEWVKRLKGNAAYEGVDVEREYGKLIAWCEANGKQPTKRRFVNWLNRADRPLQGEVKPPRVGPTLTECEDYASQKGFVEDLDYVIHWHSTWSARGWRRKNGQIDWAFELSKALAGRRETEPTL